MFSITSITKYILPFYIRRTFMFSSIVILKIVRWFCITPCVCKQKKNNANNTPIENLRHSTLAGSTDQDRLWNINTLHEYNNTADQTAQYYLSTSSDSEFVRLLTEQLTRMIHRKPEKKEREAAKKKPPRAIQRDARNSQTQTNGGERENRGMATRYNRESQKIRWCLRYWADGESTLFCTHALYLLLLQLSSS